MNPDIQDSFFGEVESEDDSTLSATNLLDGVSVTDSDWTAETVLSQVEKANIALNPRFQRREAWDDRRKSRFIESLILGLPIPQLVLAELRGNRGRYVVIDGKQRLLSLVRFTGIGDVTQQLVLKGLEIRSDLNGLTWAELQSDPKYQADVAAFENAQIRTTVVKGWKDEKALYLIFHRLNSGSVPLSPQELRHVLHPGPYIDFAFDFAEASNVFISILGSKGKPDFRMRDVELLIRFTGFALFLETYEGDLKEFLDSTVFSLNKSWGQQSAYLQRLSSSCEEAMTFTMNVFGEEEAFAKWTQRGSERRFNRAVFDVMTYYFADFEVRWRIEAEGLTEKVKTDFQSLCISEPRFMRALESTTKTKEAVLTRLFLWGSQLKETIGIEIPAFSKVAQLAQRHGIN